MRDLSTPMRVTISCVIVSFGIIRLYIFLQEQHNSDSEFHILCLYAKYAFSLQLHRQQISMRNIYLQQNGAHRT